MNCNQPASVLKDLERVAQRLDDVQSELLRIATRRRHVPTGVADTLARIECDLELMARQLRGGGNP